VSQTRGQNAGRRAESWTSPKARSKRFGGVLPIDSEAVIPGWSPVTTVTNVFGLRPFTDHAATNNGARFYRARLVP
jgi:hypothetical protein